MTQEITEITIVPDSKLSLEYEQGELGQPLKPHSNSWMICCPGCGYLSNIGLGKIIKNEDGTVSTMQPLHCHGSKARQRYSIEHNAVRWI